MSTRKQANKAREQHAEALEKSGAHAIGVDKVERDGKETFGVIAYYESIPEDCPDTIEIEESGVKKDVPVDAVESPMAQLE